MLHRIRAIFDQILIWVLSRFLRSIRLVMGDLGVVLRKRRRKMQRFNKGYDEEEELIHNAIVAAREIQEFLWGDFNEKNGFFVASLPKEQGGKWYCEFPLPKWSDATADTAPEAICRAALEAVK